MKLLLDSNVLLWSLQDRSQLTRRVRTLLEDEGNDLFVSTASLWELSLKIASGKLPVPGSSIQSVIDQLRRLSITILPITTTHILRTESLPFHHRDPFDRLLIAQALEDRLTLLTSDRQIARYAVPIIWR